MPIIHALLSHDAAEERALLRGDKTAVRIALAEVTGYDLFNIALYPRILSVDETELADNILPLVFVIDLGIHPAIGVNDEFSRRFVEQLFKVRREYRNIHFGVWIIQNKNNGHWEHEPPKQAA